MTTITTGAIERARAGAELVKKASGAIAGAVHRLHRLPRPDDGVTAAPTPTLGLEPKSLQRLSTLITVSNKVATRRLGALRMSVVALGVGLFAIAAPFVSFSRAASTYAAAPTTPAWPAPPHTGSADLDKVLFDAQVKETADLRASAKSTDSRAQDLAILVLGLVLGLALVVGVPRVIDAKEKPADAAGSPALADVASLRLGGPR